MFLDCVSVWVAFSRQYPQCNLAILWPGCQVDPDSSQALEWLRQHEVNVHGNAWGVSTSRGVRIFYAALNVHLTTFTDQHHVLPDLLAPGRLAVVPPSIHPSGAHYTWISGHTPLDIPISSLEPPPEALLRAWQRVTVPQPPLPRLSQPPGWLGLVFQAICDELEVRGHRLRPSGDGFTTRCPLHDDKHPSMSIHPLRGWKCFAGCGEGRLTLLAARLGVRVKLSEVVEVKDFDALWRETMPIR